jgi:hypothetical protein
MDVTCQTEVQGRTFCLAMALVTLACQSNENAYAYIS